MMPDMQAPAGMPPEGMPPEGAPAGGEDMKPMLIQVLKKVKDTADKAGISFDDLVAEVAGGSPDMEEGEPTSPASPSPDMLAGMQ